MFGSRTNEEIEEMQKFDSGTDKEFKIFSLDENKDYRLDFSLLNRYILPRMKIKTIADGKTSYITTSFH